MSNESYVVAFEKLRMQDVGRVGGKNASLGEMIGQLANAGVRVPGGFATTAQAYRDFLAHGGLAKRIEDKLAKLNVDDVNALAAAGAEVRGWITAQPFPEQLEKDIGSAYAALQQGANDDLSVAVRSSATAEDLPDASFAGQQETFLNIHGLASVLDAVKHVFASLYNDRAISYRVHKNFIHADVALSAGIQRMVRSDLAASGVMFTLDTESGFDQVVFITAAYGLGETVVQGQVNPDEFYVYKPALKAGKKAIVRRNLGSKALRMTFTDSREAGKSVRTDTVSEADRRRFSISDADVEELARAALIIEQHYKRAMDIEWGRDGADGKLYILQARPETVKASEKVDTLRRYRLKQRSDVLASGRAIGQRVGSGPVKLVQSAAEMDRVQAGDVLVTDMTDPDWEPVMKRASAIITNRGGRTCHAAIIARELGIPAVVGCGDATKVLREGQPITVSCAEGDTGFIYDGALPFEQKNLELDSLPPISTKIMMNVGNPDRAFDFASIPHRGVGLARLEFIINRMIGVHPRALLEFDQLSSELQQTIRRQMSGYADPVSFFVEKLCEGVSTIAAAFAPEPVIVRLSDFKSNEYAN